jgi:thiamine biosynthesis lipoprotein
LDLRWFSFSLTIDLANWTTIKPDSIKKIVGKESMINQSHPSTWQSYSFRAMGSHIQLWLDTADKRAADCAFEQVEALFAVNEQALSRFRASSELSRLNEQSGQWVVVSDLMWTQINLAVEMAAMTNGRFDPTLLNALEQAGYLKSFETMISGRWNGRGSEFEQLFGQWRAIEFDNRNQAVHLPFGVRLDLGGISKGDTAQQALEILQETGPCLIDAGGDLVAGLAPDDFPGWPIAIGSPWSSNGIEQDDLFTIWLADGALATSGIDYRNWQREGVFMHHLIDPHTGKPAETDGLTVTILAETAAVAESWATATLVAGSRDGMAALLDQKLAGLMVTQDGRVLVTPTMDYYLQGQLSSVE